MDSLETKYFSVTAYDQPWTMVNAHELFVFFVLSLTDSIIYIIYAYSNTVMLTSVFARTLNIT